MERPRDEDSGWRVLRHSKGFQPKSVAESVRRNQRELHRSTKFETRRLSPGADIAIIGMNPRAAPLIRLVRRRLPQVSRNRRVSLINAIMVASTITRGMAPKRNSRTRTSIPANMKSIKSVQSINSSLNPHPQCRYFGGSRLNMTSVTCRGGRDFRRKSGRKSPAKLATNRSYSNVLIGCCIQGGLRFLRIRLVNEKQKNARDIRTLTKVLHTSWYITVLK